MQPTDHERIAERLLQQCMQDFGIDLPSPSASVPGTSFSAPWRIVGRGVREDDGVIVVMTCRVLEEPPKVVAYQILIDGAASDVVVRPVSLRDGDLALTRAAHRIGMSFHAAADARECTQLFVKNILTGAVDDGCVAKTCEKCGIRFDAVEPHDTMCFSCIDLFR